MRSSVGKGTSGRSQAVEPGEKTWHVQGQAVCPGAFDRRSAILEILLREPAGLEENQEGRGGAPESAHCPPLPDFDLLAPVGNLVEEEVGGGVQYLWRKAQVCRQAHQVVSLFERPAHAHQIHVPGGPARVEPESHQRSSQQEPIARKPVDHRINDRFEALSVELGVHALSSIS